MAVVREIRTYPIKGMDPALVSEARLLDASGALAGDRGFVLVDARGRFVNGKNRPAIHAAVRARFDADGGEVALNGRAFSLAREGVAIAAWFSELLGEPLEWREDAARGFPDDTEAPGPTLIGEASLNAVAGWFGLDGEGVRRRFRANIEIAGLAPFREDLWYGGRVRFGGGGAALWAQNPCARCVVPSRDALTGADTAGFQKRFMELRQATLPEGVDAARFDHHYRLSVNTRPASPGIIRVGDEMTVEFR